MYYYIKIDSLGNITGYRKFSEKISDESYIFSEDISNFDQFSERINEKQLRWKSGTFKFQYDPNTNSISRTANDTNQLECTIAKKRVQEGNTIDMTFRVIDKDGNFDNTFQNNIFIDIEESDADVITAKIKIVDGEGSLSRVFSPNNYDISDIGNIIGEPKKIHVIKDRSFIVYVQ